LPTDGTPTAAQHAAAHLHSLAEQYTYQGKGLPFPPFVCAHFNLWSPHNVVDIRESSCFEAPCRKGGMNWDDHVAYVAN
jgi:hypothetical protein